MKRHVQLPGVRKWSGDDLIDLQAEPFKIFDGFFEQFGPMILCGCHVAENNISSGLVVLPETIEGKVQFKVTTFKGISNVPVFPVYLTLKKTTVSRDYENATVQPIAYTYEAVVNQQPPEMGTYLLINKTGNRVFTDAIQSPDYRFVTDAQIREWSTPRDFITGMEVYDLNTFIKPGLRSFICEGGEGVPDLGTFRGFSILEDEYSGTQIAIGTFIPAMYIRNRIDGEWGKWVKIWTSKSLKKSKDDTILGIKSFLPVRPVKGDAYMLNKSSGNFLNPEVPIEVYHFKVYSHQNKRNLVGDRNIALTDNSGNKIDISDRVFNNFMDNNRRLLKINGLENLQTDLIPIKSTKVQIIIKGDLRNKHDLKVETYRSNTEQVGTISYTQSIPKECIESRYIVFSDNIRYIRIKLSPSATIDLSSIQVFCLDENLLRSVDVIYRYNTEKGGCWGIEEISGKTVHVKGRNYELRRFGDSFLKTPIVRVPRLEYTGTDTDGNIYIKPLASPEPIYVRLFVKKRVSHWVIKQTGFIKSKCHSRYVEKTKTLKDTVDDRIKGKMLLDSNKMLPFTSEMLHHSLFKVLIDKIKCTTGLSEYRQHGTSERITKNSHVDIAMCLAKKVSGHFVNGEMSYFRFQNEQLKAR